MVNAYLFVAIDRLRDVIYRIVQYDTAGFSFPMLGKVLLHPCL